ncbi:hypothetical protein D3C75_715700 [compost metagenome]
MHQLNGDPVGTVLADALLHDLHVRILVAVLAKIGYLFFWQSDLICRCWNGRCVLPLMSIASITFSVFNGLEFASPFR